MKLFFNKLGEGETSLIILHGLFGSSDNWQTLGKQFAEDFTVYLVDQRNHGRSENSEDFSYDLMAQDLAEFIQDEKIDNYVVLGHSMGGKTAIQFANKYADEELKKLIIVDIGIKKYPMHHDKILEGLMAINPSKLKSRKEADEIMHEYVPEFMVKQFLLKNLYRRKGEPGYAWRINVPVLNREIWNIIDELEVDQVNTNTLFIRGGQSNYILDQDIDELLNKFPNGSVETIQESGHWIHAEAPEKFYQLVKDFILRG